jgi:hypothetical protein
VHYDAKAELLSRLEAVPHAVGAAAGLALTRPTPEGEWPPVVIVGHLVRVDESVWLPRLEEMAVVENPHWQWWEEPDFDWFGTYGHRPLGDLLADLTAARAAILDHLRQLDVVGWARVGTHDTFGLVDVQGLVRELLVHDGQHVHQLTSR